MISSVFAFVPPQDGHSSPAARTPVRHLAGFRYTAEMGARPAGVLERPLSPPPLVGLAHPGARQLLNPLVHGIGGATPSQGAYEVPPMVARLPTAAEQAESASNSAARTEAGGVAGRLVSSSLVPSGVQAHHSLAAPEYMASASLPWCSPSAPSAHGAAPEPMNDVVQGTPYAGPGSSALHPTAGAAHCSPTPLPRRARPPQCRPLLGLSPSLRESRSPSPSRTRRAPLSRSPTVGACFVTAASCHSSSPRAAGTVTAAGLAEPASEAAAAIATQVAALSRSSSLGFSGVRREMTGQRKELAIFNSQIRTLVKKVDDIAVLADRVTSTLTLQRGTLHDLATDVGNVAAEVLCARSSAATASLSAAGLASSDVPQSQEDSDEKDAQWVVLLRADINKYLMQLFIKARDAGDVWPATQHINEFSQAWTASRLNVELSAARSLLERRWRLPQRSRRTSTAEEDGDTTPAPAPASRDTTMGFLYVNRAVSHFYQKLGNKAVAAFLTFINDEEQIGSLRRLRGTQTKYEVVLSPTEAAPLLVDNSFITEFTYDSALIRALTVVFSTLGVLPQFSEDGPVRDGPRVIACRTAHLALVTMKIRQHIKMRASTTSVDDGEPVVAVPGLNAGHRAEWVEELMIISDVFIAQGDRACNGLRLTDGSAPHRADPAYRTPQVDDNTAGVVGCTTPAAVPEDHAEAAASLAAWRVIDANDEEDASNGSRDDDEHDNDDAVGAARTAARQSPEGESVE